MGSLHTEFVSSDIRVKMMWASIQVEMMRITGKYGYYEDDAVQVLAMPYKGMQAFMYFLLPRKKFGLASYEKGLSGQGLLDIFGQCESHLTEVFTFCIFSVFKSFTNSRIQMYSSQNNQQYPSNFILFLQSAQIRNSYSLN